MAGLYDYGVPQLANNMVSLYGMMEQAKHNKAIENAQNIQNQAAMFKMNSDIKKEQELNKDVMFGSLLDAKGASPVVKDKTIKYLQGLGYADAIGRVKVRNIPLALKAMNDDKDFQLDIHQTYSDEMTQQLAGIDQEIMKAREKNTEYTADEKYLGLVKQKAALQVRAFNNKQIMDNLLGKKGDSTPYTAMSDGRVLNTGTGEVSGEPKAKSLNETELVTQDLRDKLKREPTAGEVIDGINRLKKERLQLSVDVRGAGGSGGGGNGTGSLTPDAVSQEGAKYLLTGKLPFTGMGGAGRKEMINESARIAKEHGWSPNMVLRMQADYKGMDKSLSAQRKNYDAMNGFVINMDKQMERLTDVYAKLPRSQYKLLNIPIRALRTRVAGSGEEAAAQALLIELGNESGKLSTNSGASIRELSESAQKQWSKIHDGTLSMNELKTVLDTTRKLGHDRINSTKEAMDFTLQGIESLGSGNQLPEKPKTTQKTLVKKQYSESRKQTRFIYSDGSEEIKDGRQ